MTTNLEKMVKTLKKLYDKSVLPFHLTRLKVQIHRFKCHKRSLGKNIEIWHIFFLIFFDNNFPKNITSRTSIYMLKNMPVTVVEPLKYYQELKKFEKRKPDRVSENRFQSKFLVMDIFLFIFHIICYFYYFFSMLYLFFMDVLLFYFVLQIALTTYKYCHTLLGIQKYKIYKSIGVLLRRQT